MANSKISLDLSHFKHVKSDKNSTTLEHKKLGHSITLAHSSLTPDNQKALSNLSKMAKDSGLPTDKAEAKADAQMLAKGGKASSKNIRHYADGGDVADNDVPQGLDPNAPEANMQTATQPDLNADMNNLYTPEQIQHQAMVADLLKVDPEVWRQAQASALGAMGTVGEVGELGALEGEGSAAAEGAMTKMPAKGYDMPARGVGKGVKIIDNVPKQNPLVTNIVNKNPVIGNRIPAYADGGDVPEALSPDAPAEDLGTATQYDPNQGASYTPPEAAQSMAMDDLLGEVKDPRQLMGGKLGIQPQQPMASPTAESADMDYSSAAPQQPQGARPQQPAGGQLSPADGMDIEAGINRGFANQMEGIKQEAAAKGKLGQIQAQAIDDSIKARTEAQVAYQEHYGQLEQERQAHMQDIKDGYIDPNKYWTGDAQGNGSHSKIAAGIGMILAGFNPTNNPNAAINFLKSQMDNNLEAQKQNLGAKQNLLSANLRQFGNLKDATEMTRMMQNDLMTSELQSAAAKAQTPLAKAQALQAIGPLQRENAVMQQQFAMRRAMMSLANSPNQSPQAVSQMLGYMRITNPEQAKEMESRFIPNVGLASTPVPDSTRKEITSKQQFNDALVDLRQWTTQHSGDLSPTDIATGKAKAANVQNLYREGINGGVFKQGEQGFISQIIDSDPTKFFNSVRVLPKLDEAMRGNAASLNVLKKSYGLPVQNTQAPQIKVVNGVKYMRGPNGEAIRVK